MRFTSTAQTVSPEESRAKADALIAWLRTYIERRFHSQLYDQRRLIPPYVAIDLGNKGLFGVHIETKYGGLGLRYADIGRVFAQLAAADLGVTSFVVAAIFPGTRPISEFATPELKAELLPKLASGRMFSAYAQTEEAAGSDFTKLQTRAIPAGRDTYKISGDKFWIGNGTWASKLVVLAQVCDEAGNPLDLGAFVVDSMAPGVSQGAEMLSMGMRGMVQSRLHFRDVVVDAGHALGSPTQGLMVAVDSMMFARFIFCCAAVGAMKRTMQLMVRFANRREIGAGKLIEYGTTLSFVAEIACQIRASEALVEWLVEMMESSAGADLEPLAAGKAVTSEFLWEATDRFIQVLGARGYDENNIAPQMLRDARVYRIFEGATEPLLDFVGRRILNNSYDFETLFKQRASSPDLADAIERARQGLRSRSAKAPYNESQWQDLQAYLTSDVFVRALLLAALRVKPRTDKLHTRAVAWAEAAFAKAVNNAAKGDASELHLCSVDDLNDEVLSYARDIGDIEQQLPGESVGLDPLLRRTPT